MAAAMREGGEGSGLGEVDGVELEMEGEGLEWSERAGWGTHELRGRSLAPRVGFGLELGGAVGVAGVVEGTREVEALLEF